MDESRKQKIIKAVTGEKITIKELASKLFMTERQLRILFENWGVELPRKRRYNKVPRPDREALMALYKKYGNTAKLAEYLNVGINTVNRWMKELIIPTRKMKMSKEEKVKFLEEHLGMLDKINL